MATPAPDRVMPFGVGDGGGYAGGGGGLPGCTALVVVAGLMQLLGFAIPVVVSATAEGATGYEFQWSYETFRLQSPGLAELFFFLPVMGHASITTTADFYLGVSDDLAAKVNAAFSRSA